MVPPAVVNGVSVTGSSTGSATVFTAAYTSCTYTTPANSIHLGGTGAFTYTFNFAVPVNNVVIVLTATGSPVAEVFTFTTNMGNPTITANVSVSNSENTETILVTINLNNANELNTEDFDVTIDENPTDGQVLGAVQATGDGTLNYSITSQTPANALAINASTGELTVVDPNLFDFETNPVLTADILVDNSVNTETLIATIALNDLDEASAQNLNVGINENPTNGEVLGTIQANGGNLTYTITFQNPAGAFNINASTGELTVADATLFDFETNPNMLATISVENSVNMVSVNANIDLNDLHEVGDFKFGGVIFWINPASNNSSGLVVGLQEDNLSWDCSGTVTGATGTAIYTGSTNTAAILAAGCTFGWSAVTVVSASNWNGYNDWFLPSYDELNELYLNKVEINTSLAANNGTSLDNASWYWTSTEESANNAYFQFFGNGLQTLNAKSNVARVRFVRSWTDF